MRKFISVIAITAVSLFSLGIASASAHDDYFPFVSGDHYGHWPGTGDNGTVAHPGVSPTWAGMPLGGPSQYGGIKYVGAQIGWGTGGSCSGNHVANTVAHIHFVLDYEAGRNTIGLDGIGCYGIHTVAAVQDLQRFFGLPVTGTVNHATLDVLDFLASNG